MYQNLIITSQSAKQQIIKDGKIAYSPKTGQRKLQVKTGKQITKSENKINKLIKNTKKYIKKLLLNVFR